MDGCSWECICTRFRRLFVFWWKLENNLWNDSLPKHAISTVKYLVISKIIYIQCIKTNRFFLYFYRISFPFYRCCKESEVLPSSSNHKQKGNTTKAGTSHSIRCEPNTLNQTSYVQPGGLSEEYQRNGGSITKRNRLYRQTSFTCHHNKKWASTAIAKPNSEFKKKEILGI